MKITDPEVIKNGEKDLIASVQEDLDPEAVREILKQRLSMAALESRGGQIVVHDNEIAFKLDFQVNLSGSLLFDRNGNLIEDAPPGEATEPEQEEDQLLAPEEKEALEANAQEDDIIEDLEDIAPEQALTGEETEDMSAGAMDDLSIDLPDYDLEDEAMEAGDIEDVVDTELDDEPEAVSDLDPDLPPDLAAELENETLEEETLPADEEGQDLDAGDLDDDINDLLKESREFWAQKKNS